ncbi:unnamed protein product [Urochloa decumbens]|uniref:LysM domain-containing protein n=1 Tax=Urochloa decumbens TaxID=240449 RepID=A0ABC9A738_9POAL
MAKHAAAALLVASLLVAVALAGAADARRPLRATITVNRLGVGARHVVKPLEETDAAVPSLSCSKVHGVQEGESCFSVAQGSGLTQDDFLGFNPNINCAKVFIGQWVCLAATPSA